VYWGFLVLPASMADPEGAVRLSTKPKQLCSPELAFFFSNCTRFEDRWHFLLFTFFLDERLAKVDILAFCFQNVPLKPKSGLATGLRRPTAQIEVVQCHVSFKYGSKILFYVYGIEPSAVQLRRYEYLRLFSTGLINYPTQSVVMIYI